MGVVSLPSERSTRFGTPVWPGIRTANFAALGSWPGVRQKDAESLRDSDALMRVAVPRRRGPTGLRSPAFNSCLANRKFYQKGCFTALLIRRNRWLPTFQPRLVDF